MRLGALIEVSERVKATSRKKEKVALMAGLLRQARGRELGLTAQYLSGQIPQGRLGIGWSTLERAMDDLSPISGPLDLLDLDIRFDALAREKGAGSTERKLRLLREILSQCSASERPFLVGLILGEVRQGALEGLVLEAVAQAASLDRGWLRQVLMFSGNIGEVARVAMKQDAAGLAQFGPKLFQPISPMLASPADGEEEAATRLGEAGWEYKIDGARVQVHKAEDEVRVFSRHLRDVTESVPEIVALVRTLPMREAILEGEVIALGREGKPLPFQITMRRFGRTKNVARMQEEIPLTPYFFDLLHVDGEAILDVPYGERVERLAGCIPPAYAVPRIVTADQKEAREFLVRSLEAGHEGIMAKKLDSPYQAGQRGFLWLKIKRAHTLDLVVLAAEWGHGRRRGWLSNLHLGARDPVGGGFVMLGKTFKGLTDDMLRWQTERLLGLEIGRDDWTVYVRPDLVVEVAFSDPQESPRYPGGLALRFARVKAFRPDKFAQEADTMDTVRRIFEASRR